MAIVAKDKIGWAKWLNPTTARHQFGTVAIFLLAGGILLLVVMPSRLLVPWSGALHYVPMGVLWWLGALPFGLFAILYWLFVEGRGLVCNKRMVNIHFALTLVWLLDLVRLVFSWQNSLLARLPVLQLSDYLVEIGILFAVCCVFFLLALGSAHREEVK
jgi:hypothetical protein